MKPEDIKQLGQLSGAELRAARLAHKAKQRHQSPLQPVAPSIQEPQPAPAIVTIPQEEEATSRGVYIAIALVAMAIFLLFVGGLTFAFVNFASTSESYGYEKDALTGEIVDLSTRKPVTVIPVETILSEANIERYRAGNGYKVELITRNDPDNGYQSSTVTVEVEKLPSFQKVRNGIRNPDITEKSQVLRAKVAEFLRSKPVERTHMVYVDNTGGIDARVRSTVRTALDDFGLKQKLAAGDKVTVCIVYLTSTDYRQPVNEVPFGKPDDLESGIAKVMELLPDQAPKEKSYVASGLFNQMNENRQRLNQSMAVISDFRENSDLVNGYDAAGVKFFEDAAAADDGGTFDATMSKNVPIPDFSRIYHVALYAPPSSETKLTRTILKAWRGLFIRGMAKSIKTQNPAQSDASCLERAKSRVEEPHV